MKKYTLLLIALLAACSAPGETAELSNSSTESDQPSPEQVRIDGTIPVEDLPWMPDRVEPNGQAFASAQLYGHLDHNSDAPCYAGNTPTTNCIGPSTKRFKYTLNLAACDTLGSLTAQQRSDVKAGINFAFPALNTYGGMVWGTATTSAVTVSVKCGTLPAGALGATGIDNTKLTKVFIGLPVAPNGNDAQDWFTYNNASIVIDPVQMVAECAPCTSLQLQNMSGHAAEHEGMHVAGFSHFRRNADADIMYPFTGRFNTIVLPDDVFDTALRDYNLAVAGGSIVDNGLSAEVPCVPGSSCP
jgi:hypothetical protein